eukprot:sb/3477922/
MRQISQTELKMGEWAHGLTGCFDDCGTCVITLIAPCVTYGRNGEASGVFESCFWAGIRGAIREKHGIEGGCFGDFMTIICCGLCALVQENQQGKVSPGGEMPRT